MLFSTGAWILPLGFLLAAPAAELEAPQEKTGTLVLSLIGNGRICARLHEDAVVEKITEERAWRRLFTTYGYRFRLYAVSRDRRGLEFVLFDTGERKTTYRKPGQRPFPQTRNPMPDAVVRQRQVGARDVWLKSAACRSFPRRSEHRLPAGEYELRILYQVQSPNGTWFTAIDETDRPWRIERRQTTERRVRILDDGNRREIYFFEPAESAERAGSGAEAGGEEGG